LKSLLVIPRDPSSVPLAERPVESLSAEELQQLVRQMREDKEANEAKIETKTEVKTEPGMPKTEWDNFEDGEIEIVSCRSKRRRLNDPAALRADDAEVIDLADD